MKDINVIPNLPLKLKTVQNGYAIFEVKETNIVVEDTRPAVVELAQQILDCKTKLSNAKKSKMAQEGIAKLNKDFDQLKNELSNFLGEEVFVTLKQIKEMDRTSTRLVFEEKNNDYQLKGILNVLTLRGCEYHAGWKNIVISSLNGGYKETHLALCIPERETVDVWKLFPNRPSVITVDDNGEIIAERFYRQEEAIKLPTPELISAAKKTAITETLPAEDEEVKPKKKNNRKTKKP